MTDQQPSDSPVPNEPISDVKAGERFSRTSRLILWVVTIGVVTTAVIEGKTLFDCWTTYNRVNTAILDKAELAGDHALFENEFQELIRGNPTRQKLSEFREELIWKSLFNEQVLIVTLGRIDGRIASIETQKDDSN